MRSILFKKMGEADFAPFARRIPQIDPCAIRDVHVFITDEICVEGAQQFAAMSFRAMGATENANRFWNLGVFLCGGFAQIRPVGEKTIISPISAGRPIVEARLGNAGRGISDPAQGCSEFRAIYRQGTPFHFKESTRRPRDFSKTRYKTTLYAISHRINAHPN